MLSHEKVATIQKRLTQKYLFVLCLLGASLLAGYFIFATFLRGMDRDGYLINLSGRQRMLSQRITFLKVAQLHARDPRLVKTIQDRLNRSIDEMEMAHKTILASKSNSQVFNELYFGTEYSLDSEIQQFLSQARDSREIYPNQILINSLDRLLDKLDYAVSRFEAESSRHDWRLIQIQRAVVIFGFLVLIASALLIFRPMTQEIADKTKLLVLEKNHVQLLLDVAVIANQASTSEKAITETLERVCHHAGLPVGHAYLVDSKDHRLLNSTNLWHLDRPESFQNFREVTEKTPLGFGVGLPGRVLESGKPAWIDDVERDGNFPRNKAATKIGVHSAFAFPIVVQNRTVAVLEFFSDRVIDRDETILTVVAHVGRQLGQVFERETSEVALRKERDTADKANQTKSVFLANISHELRTPLHGILSFARLGRQKLESAPKEKLGTYFEEICDSGARLMSLLNDLLDLSKLESGKVVYSMREESLVSVARSVASELKAFSEEKGLKLEVESGEHDFVGVFDGEKLMQVLRNLISNAIKFSEKSSVVRVAFAQTSEMIECRVINRGVGIPESELDAVFDKFVQSSKTKTGAGGTGLGLAICREIIEQHGGKIWAESKLNEETKFIFELPRAGVVATPERKAA